jgi:hypothetical protein
MMKARCNNPQNHAYADYGGRGIKVCKCWDASFDAFYADMGPRPEGLTLDRIDNNKGYEPGNCRWATRKEQGCNKRDTHWVEHDGKRTPLVVYAEQRGISYSSAYRWFLNGELIERTTKPLWSQLNPSIRIRRARTTKTSQSEHFKAQRDVKFKEPADG